MQIVSERGTTPSDWNAQKDSSCFTRGRQAHSDPGASDGALSNRALQKPPRSPGQLIHPPPPTPAVQPLALEHQPLQRWRTAIRKCSQHGRKTSNSFAFQWNFTNLMTSSFSLFFFLVKWTNNLNCQLQRCSSATVQLPITSFKFIYISLKSSQIILVHFYSFKII